MNVPRAVMLHRGRWMVVILAVFMALGLWFMGRFRLAVDEAKERCLPYSVFLIDLNDHTPQRHTYFAFRTRGLSPVYVDGTPFIKQVAGVPGDRIDIDEKTVAIGGEPWGPLSTDIVSRLGLSPSQLVRHDVLGADRFLMLGVLPPSYDGRYWGDVSRDQLIGRAYPLW